MPYHFEWQSFGRLVDDAQSLYDRASSLERALASLEAACASALDSDPAWADARRAARDQVAASDALRRRLLGATVQESPSGSLVLVVDDSQEAREATALLLEGAGFRAVTAANGLEALLVAHYARPAVALLDLMMPVLDGLQTARLLSESPSTRHVRVIAYSGRADMFSRRLPGTFTAILAKPTTPEELLTMVQQQAVAAGADTRLS